MQSPIESPERTAEADRYVLIAGHVLFTVLLAIGTIRAVLTTSTEWAPICAAVVTALWYCAGAVWASRQPGALIPRLWLLGLIVLWFGLISLSSEFIWLAFLLAMLIWHLFPPRAALPLVITVTVATVVAFGIHQGQWVIGAILGPTVGIASAVVMTGVYQGLRAQSEERRRLLQELMATQQALAAREREAGMLGERERLAREIHDTVGQSLASVALLLRAALAPAKSDDPQSERDNQLRTALETTLAALAETRQFIRGLDPVAIERNGLTQALGALAQESTELGLPTEFRHDGAVRTLDTSVQVALLRAAQEAMSNARKHARARHATITLTFQGDEISIDIVDDGAGFDPAAVGGIRADGSGYGLTSMRARITERGGELTIESEPGRGTAVRATVPVEPAPIEPAAAEPSSADERPGVPS
ncbi:sensor histidine kinase [Rhodococcus sp. D2-41]|uniref:sensor histidine kinase n=1 Tax=Speluncibacter jeojiensis TaxID=2710754 RepID=UPI00240EECEB|nr:sensor histidine kinase [Rhodococcus sp. D2-41]MDG3008629.1 sensor histidine kinase [Rhodococcus sp. D2-41]